MQKQFKVLKTLHYNKQSESVEGILTLRSKDAYFVADGANNKVYTDKPTKKQLQARTWRVDAFGGAYYVYNLI